MAGRWDAAHRVWTSADGLWAIRRMAPRTHSGVDVPAHWELRRQGRFVARGSSYLALRLAIGELKVKALPEVG